MDLDTIGVVADPHDPTGPLGGLGPLPLDHEREESVTDLGEYDFGLTDADMRALLEGLASHQVAVVVAGTGTGKSTFLPYRLLVPPTGARLQLAKRGPIVVTEPRRAAATDTAHFVAEKLHRSTVGAGSDVGYRVKGEPAFDASCRLLFVTDGSLINWLRDGSFKRFSAIMVDEAHERSKNIDVILGLLRDILPRNPHLKLIVASATIDAGFFVDYFGGSEAVFQLDAPATKVWGYGQPLWPGGEIDLNHPDWFSMDSGQPREGPREIGHRDDRTAWIGPFGADELDLQDVTRRLAELRTVAVPIAPGPGVATWRKLMPQLVAEQVLAILGATVSGDVLAFLPGLMSIEEAVTLIRAGADETVDVIPLLRTSPPETQERARGAKTDLFRRRVIVSTNIAETSLTIDGITFVVDSGLIHQSEWDVDTASKRMPAVLHSKDGVRQRWGRVGRKAPGWVFPLYTQSQYQTLFPEHTPPEATRDDLEQFVLTAKAAGVEEPGSYEWPSSFRRPGAELSKDADAYAANFSLELLRAGTALVARGALDADGDLTATGGDLQAFSGSMAHALALVLGDHLGCLVEVATALLLLSGGRTVGMHGLLRFNRDWSAATRNDARRLHDATRADCLDDLDLVLKVYAAWESQAAERRADWAANHLINHQVLASTEVARADYLKPLMTGRKSTECRPVNLALAPRARVALSRALADQTYARAGAHWAPIGREPSNHEWRLDALALGASADRLIALRRAATSGAQVWLSSLVVADAWVSESDAGWLPVALAAAARQRAADGKLYAATTADHLVLWDEWRVGERYRCSVLPGQGEIRLCARERLSGPLVVTDTAGVRDAVSGVGAAGTDEVDDHAWTTTTDLVSLAPPGAVDVTQEVQFTDVRTLEAPEDGSDDVLEVPVTGAHLHNGGRDNALPAPLPLSTPVAVIHGNLDQPSDEVCVRVLGYEGLGLQRALHVGVFGQYGDSDASHKPEAPADGATSTYGLVRTWGPPFTVELDRTDGSDRILDEGALPPEGSLVHGSIYNVKDDLGVFVWTHGINALLHKSQIGPRGVATPSRYFREGQTIEATLRSVVKEGANLRVQLSMREMSIEDVEAAPVWTAETIRERFRELEPVAGKVNNVLDHLGVFVTLWDGLSGLARKQNIGSGGVAMPSEEFKKGQEVLVVLRGVDVDPNGKLLIQLSIPSWESGTQLRGDRAVTTWSLEEAQAKLPPGHRLTGTISNVVDKLGVFVTLPEGLTGMIHKTNLGLGPGARGTFTDRFQKGQDVEVVVTAVVGDKSGRPRIQLALRMDGLPDQGIPGGGESRT